MSFRRARPPYYSEPLAGQRSFAVLGGLCDLRGLGDIKTVGFSDSARRRTGFSLVEIMIVIVIIGLLAGMVTVNIRGRMIQAKQNIARGDVAKISEAIEHFYATYSRYPTNEEGLTALTQASERIPAPLLDGKLSDPWGKRYQYNCPGRSKPYDVICYGEDGREGGEGANADIRSDALQQ